ncbi:MAG: helix-turn-helix transcriptional regulator [Bacillota bacterium]|nr:helix-turn-helix transcriptional regulator [Bacillota bacterium]
MKVSKFEISDFVPAKSIDKVLLDLVNREVKSRKSQKISQRELAKRSGVSYASIRRFETTGNISLYALFCIANCLGCLEDFDSLFKPRPITNLKELFN